MKFNNRVALYLLSMREGSKVNALFVVYATDDEHQTFWLAEQQFNSVDDKYWLNVSCAVSSMVEEIDDNNCHVIHWSNAILRCCDIRNGK